MSASVDEVPDDHENRMFFRSLNFMSRLLCTSKKNLKHKKTKNPKTLSKNIITTTNNNSYIFFAFSSPGQVSITALQHIKSDHQLGLSNGHYYVSLQCSRGHYNLTGQWTVGRSDFILFRIFIVICEAHTGSPVGLLYADHPHSSQAHCVVCSLWSHVHHITRLTDCSGGHRRQSGSTW